MPMPFGSIAPGGLGQVGMGIFNGAIGQRRAGTQPQGLLSLIQSAMGGNPQGGLLKALMGGQPTGTPPAGGVPAPMAMPGAAIGGGKMMPQIGMLSGLFGPSPDMAGGAMGGGAMSPGSW